MDETEYLLSSPANAEILLKSIDNINKGINIISFATIEEATQAALDRAAGKPWRSLYGICKDTGDTTAAYLERKHANRAHENAALEQSGL